MDKQTPNTYGQRIAFARKNIKKVSQEELGKLAGGLKQGTISGLESGKSDSTSSALEIARALGVSVDWLLTGKGEPRPNHLKVVKDEKSSENVHAVPYLNVYASMGSGAIPPESEYSIASVDLTSEWIRRNLSNITSPSNLRLIKGLGDSMQPFFKEGDAIFIDTGVKTIEIDAIFAFMYLGQVYVKRVQRTPDGLKVISDNKQYDPFTIAREKFSELVVFGRVGGVLEFKMA